MIAQRTTGRMAGRRTGRLWPIPDPAQEAEGALTQRVAPEQGCTDDRQHYCQLDADNDRAESKMEYPDADRGSERDGTDPHRSRPEQAP